MNLLPTFYGLVFVLGVDVGIGIFGNGENVKGTR